MPSERSFLMKAVKPSARFPADRVDSASSDLRCLDRLHFAAGHWISGDWIAKANRTVLRFANFSTIPIKSRSMRYLGRALAPVAGITGTVIAAMIALGQDKPLLTQLRDWPVLRYFPDNRLLLMILVIGAGLQSACVIVIRLNDRRAARQQRGLLIFSLIPAMLVALWVPRHWVGLSEGRLREFGDYSWVSATTLEIGTRR